MKPPFGSSVENLLDSLSMALSKVNEEEGGNDAVGGHRGAAFTKTISKQHLAGATTAASSATTTRSGSQPLFRPSLHHPHHPRPPSSILHRSAAAAASSSSSSSSQHHIMGLNGVILREGDVDDDDDDDDDGEGGRRNFHDETLDEVIEDIFKAFPPKTEKEKRVEDLMAMAEEIGNAIAGLVGIIGPTSTNGKPTSGADETLQEEEEEEEEEYEGEDSSCKESNA